MGKEVVSGGLELLPCHGLTQAELSRGSWNNEQGSGSQQGCRESAREQGTHSGGVLSGEKEII